MAKHLETSRVLALDEVVPDVYTMELSAPQICEAAVPGQFVHLRVLDSPVQLLRMPFCVYDVDAQADSIEIMFQVVGEGTTQLAGLHVGDGVDLIGPVGNGWSMPKADRALLISGGLGAAPLNMLARGLQQAGTRVDVVMGAVTSQRLVCRDRLQASVDASGGTLEVATDDGSEGLCGFCTQISAPKIESGDYDYVCICGPGPMERVAVQAALEAGVTCEVSLERLMACGVGACLSCIVETVEGRKRCCVDGPVFDATEVIW